jgi:hypothetical protein
MRINNYNIYIYTHTLFITLGDGHIGPSPGLANSLIDRANQPTCAPARDRGHARPPAPSCLRLSGSAPHAPAQDGAYVPVRAECLLMPGADRPRTSQPTPRATTHASQPFSVFAQSFVASVSHFLVSLSHLTTMNLAIFGIVNSVILATMNSVI